MNELEDVRRVREDPACCDEILAGHAARQMCAWVSIAIGMLIALSGDRTIPWIYVLLFPGMYIIYIEVHKGRVAKAAEEARGKKK